MEGLLVGASHVGGLDVLGGGDGDMNTTFNIFNRGELFPYVATVDTSGFAYFNRGEVYPAIYYIAPTSTAGISVSPALRMIRWMLR